jgi:DnaJ-domain-containing protein 1
MSIGRRLFDLARGELNALLDRTAGRESQDSYSADWDPNEDLYRRYSLGEFSDEELEAELERRLRLKRQGTATSASKTARSAPRPASPPRSSPPRKPSANDEVRLAYSTLELPIGSDFEAVRRSYRALMRKYHPDRHTASAEKQKAATELAQKLTHAYAVLERHLRG